ncbi:MAG: ABC transporter substrate-binding protein [Candidatus Bathyarchaeia archaeon]|jgi:peptide/nickel transport system substrate-binding protein
MQKRIQIAIAALVIIIVVGGSVWYALTPRQAPTTKQPTLLSMTESGTGQLDPAVGSDETSSVEFVNLYDTLVYPTATGGVTPDIATQWSGTPDSLTWTFTLRTGTTFHDGTPLTANDVVFSLNRMLTIGQGYSYLFTPYVSTVTAPDNYTVVITLKRPFGPFVNSLVRIYILNKQLVMSHVKTPGPYGANGDYGSDWLLTHDAGSGAYMVKEVSVNEYVLMEKYSNYWGQFVTNAPDEVKLYGTTEPATVKTMLSKGQIDITDRWQSSEAINDFSKMNNVTIVNIPTSAELYLMINTKKPPTDDIYVREAMTYAFDYQTGAAVFPGSPVAAGPVPTVLPGHDPNAMPYTQDIAKAQALLKQSRYYGQFDKYPVVYHWIADVPDEEKVALLFADNMKAIGLPVNVVKIPWISVVAEMGNESSTPNVVSIFVEASYTEAGSILQQRYSSQSVGTWEQGEWLQNSTIDSMIANALATTDQTQRFQKYAQIQEVLMSMYPSIFVCNQVERRAYYAGYVDWYAAHAYVPVLGYDFNFRLIGLDASKKAALFGSS